MKWRGVLGLMGFSRGPFSGLLFGDWLRLLYRYRFRVPRSYRIPVVLITAGSIFNSIVHTLEVLRFCAKIRKAEYRPPLFVLGVPRSGTTHLFNLFSKDERYAYPNLIQAYNPHTFLCAEQFLARLFDACRFRNRGLDNVATGSKVPEEDEHALLALTQLSHLLCGPFPRLAYRYNRYLTFRSASQDEVVTWKAAIKFFVRKMSFKYGGRPLVLKSPAHTGRIRMILDVFPDAKFVFIHRNPFDVFQSYRQILVTFSYYFDLSSSDGGDAATDVTLEFFRELFEAFFEDRELIPKANYCELSYASLVEDPIGQMRRIYQALVLPEFQVVEPALQSYLASIADYKKRDSQKLPADLQARIAREWSRWFEEWGYPTSQI